MCQVTLGHRTNTLVGVSTSDRGRLGDVGWAVVQEVEDVEIPEDLSGGKRVG